MIALALNFLSPTTIRLGRYEEAYVLLQESLALTTQVGDRWGMGTAYRCLGLLALAQGNASQAETLIHKSITLFSELDARWDIARALTTLGEAKVTARDIPEARLIFRNAIRLAIEARAIPLVFDAMIGLAFLKAQTGEAEQAFELSVCALSHPASTCEAKDRAKRLSVIAEKQLSDQEIELVRQSVASQSFVNVVEKYLSGDTD